MTFSVRTWGRGLRLVAGVAAFVCVTTAVLRTSPALGQKKKPVFHAPPPTTLSDKVEALATQILSVPLDESEPITDQIQQLVLGHLQDWLATQAPANGGRDVPYDVGVRQEMDGAFAELQYPLSADCVVFAQPWKGALLTVASYSLRWSDYDRASVVALFETRGGKTRLAGVDHFVPHTDLHYAFLPSPDPASFRFLVYGTRLGKSQPRLTAMLYGYDGQTLKTLWQGRDFYDGKLQVENDSLVIRYLKEDEYVREQAYNRKPPRHLAIYKISPQGLSLASDEEIPF